MLTNALKISIFLFLTNFYVTRQSKIRFPQELISEDGSRIWAFATPQNVSCIPLSQCATFSWLLNNETNNVFVQIGPKKIKTLLQRKRCVIEEAHSDAEITLNTRTACPNLIDADDDFGEYEDYTADTTLELREDYDDECDSGSGFGGAGFSNFRGASRSKLACSLEITHGPPEDALSSLQTTRFSSPRRRYGRLKRLEKRQVLHIQAHGNCCWEIYSQSYFTGTTEEAQPGYAIYPESQPRSIKKICC